MADRLSPSYFFFVFGKIFGFDMVRLEPATLSLIHKNMRLTYMPI